MKCVVKIRALSLAASLFMGTICSPTWAKQNEQMLLLTQLPVDKLDSSAQWVSTKQGKADESAKIRPVNSDKANLYETPDSKTPVSFYCVNSSDWPEDITPEKIDLKVGPLESCASPRFITHASDTIRVGFLEFAKNSASQCPKDYSSKLSDLEVDEQPRDTILNSQLKAIFKLVVDKNAGNAAPSPDPAIPKLCYYDLGSIKLKSERATVAIKTGISDIEKSNGNINLITGPKEHLFLSGDAIVKGAKELRFDQTSNKLTERDKPSQLYLGINFMLGDLYVKTPAWSSDRLVGKILISPSKKVFDSVGIGIGWRFADGIYSTAKTSANSGFVLFVGEFWTRGDSLGGQPGDASGSYKRSTRVGISYSIGAALAWLK